ncbi:MAG: HAD-IG family 5'-nucleotidase [Pseudomonadota bacterium]|nr:MAG: 5'-nucleotidase [Pseudomonadota bacterium]
MSAESRQLALPLAGISVPPPNGHAIPRKDRVYVNRDLRLSTIDWVGFDMDYTLAIYRQNEMDRLSVELTIDRLIRRGYPSYLKKLEYDTRFPIRGLLVDKRYGHVLKMDRYKVVHLGYHGMQKIPREELNELYHHKRIRPHTPRYHWIDTLFALSEVTSYAAIVDAMERRKERVDFDKLFADVRSAIDEAHADGTVYSYVTSDLERYVERDPDLARTLHKFRSAGKKLFLLTNSPLAYTDRMMTFLLGDALPEYPSWRHYFEIVVCSAGKPRWFQEGRPLMEIDGDALRHVKGPLERGKIYDGGNLADFERLANLRGSSVLYVGDHIYGDILRSKKESSWHTAMIIPELDAEVEAHELTAADRARQRTLEDARERLENELRYYQGRYKELVKSNADDVFAQAERVRVKRALERIRAELRANIAEYDAITERVSRTFHPYWGSLLKEQSEMSSFGLQVDLYADIYTRRVSCLRHYSPQQFFRSPYDLMPHEL